MTIRIAYANVKNNRAAIRRMLNQNPDFLGLGEAYNRRRYVTTRPGYRATMGAGARDQRRGAYDNPVLTRRTLRSLGQICVEAAEASMPIKIAPDRWLNSDAALIERKPVCLICGHPHAAVKDKTTAVPRVREYAEFMDTLGRLIDLVRAEGWIPVVAMDANFPESGSSPGWTDPVELFKAKKLTTYWSGIDVIAWGGRLTKVSAKTIPAKTLGSDHPGLVVDLK